MNEVYEYRCPGRRSIVWLIAAIQAVLLWLAVTHDAPWFIWAIWVPTSLAVAYLLLANPISGLRVDDRHLVLSPWRKPREIPLSEIARVEIRDCSDSTDVVIHLRDGGAVSTFSGDIPPSRCFESILTARGVTVDRS